MTAVRRVLLTGAGGFIGRYAVPALRNRGFEVHAICRNGSIAGVHTHTVDLLDPVATASLLRIVRPSHLLHLAWNVTPGAFWHARDNLDWVAASLCLYRAFVQFGGQRMVVAGSCAEYDWQHATSDLNEDATPRAPNTLYGSSKVALYDLLAAAAPGDNISLAWGRVFFLYGPGEALSRLIPSVIVPLLRGDAAVVGHGEVTRDLMHVADVAEALVHLLASDYRGAVNIASGEPKQLRSVITEIAGYLGRLDLVQFGARPSSANEPARLTASVSKLHDDIGFRPRLSLVAGVADTVAWWRQHLTATDLP